VKRSVLLADIGATKTRLALIGKDGRLRAVRSVMNDDVADLETLLAGALATVRPRPRAAVLGVAGWIDGDRVLVTNRGWTFSRRALACSGSSLVQSTTSRPWPMGFQRSARRTSSRGRREMGAALVCGPAVVSAARC
jgi:glucokinase